MTDSLERHLSEAAIEASTPEGARELAAAEVMVRASTLLWRAFEQSGLSQRELADSLGVTEGRVSQILHGDGNVRLSTLARYLRATGYLTKLEAVPASGSVAPLRPRTPRRASRRGTADSHDIYGSLVEHEGQNKLKLTLVPSGVPLEAKESSSTNYIGTTGTRLDWHRPGHAEIGTK